MKILIMFCFIFFAQQVNAQFPQLTAEEIPSTWQEFGYYMHKEYDIPAIDAFHKLAVRVCGNNVFKPGSFELHDKYEPVCKNCALIIKFTESLPEKISSLDAVLQVHFTKELTGHSKEAIALEVNDFFKKYYQDLAQLDEQTKIVPDQHDEK